MGTGTSHANGGSAKSGIGGLHKQPLSATAGYTNTTSASIINNNLRNGGDGGDRKDVVDRLDSNMESTTKDMTVYREVDILRLVDTLKDKPPENTFESLKSTLEGQTFTEKGYYSSYYDKTGLEYGNTILVTHALKGTKAILTSNDKEKEVILGRNQSYKINSVTRKDGKFVIDVTVAQ